MRVVLSELISIWKFAREHVQHIGPRLVKSTVDMVSITFVSLLLFLLGFFLVCYDPKARTRANTSPAFISAKVSCNVCTWASFNSNSSVITSCLNQNCMPKPVETPKARGLSRSVFSLQIESYTILRL